jgi:hypothetical protein
MIVEAEAFRRSLPTEGTPVARTLWLGIAATAALSTCALLGGCAVPLQAKAPVDDKALTERISALQGASREVVHQRFSHPVLPAATWPVEVYRETATRRNGILIFAPIPIPLPDFSDHYEVYTLVVYDDDGHAASLATEMVEQKSVPFMTDIPLQIDLAAGDYRYSRTATGEWLAVSVPRFLAHHRNGSGGTCRALVACGDLAHTNDYNVNLYLLGCRIGLQVDDRAELNFSLITPVVERPVVSTHAHNLTAESCSAQGGEFNGSRCVGEHPLMIPLLLNTGHRKLKLSEPSQFPVIQKVDCDDGSLFLVRRNPGAAQQPAAWSVSPATASDSGVVVIFSSGGWLVP